MGQTGNLKTMQGDSERVAERQALDEKGTLFSVECNSAVRKHTCRGEERSSSLAILLYMTGSDLESRGGAGSADLREIMNCLPEENDIRVVAMISGAESWELSVSADETSIYELTQGAMTKKKTLPVQSMGDPDTLTSFLD